MTETGLELDSNSRPVVFHSSWLTSCLWFLDLDCYLHSNSPTPAHPQHLPLMPPSLPAPGLVHTECHELLHAPVITNVFLWTRFLLIIPRPFSVVFFTFSQNGLFKTELFTTSYFQKKNWKWKTHFRFPPFPLLLCWNPKALVWQFEALFYLAPAKSIISPSLRCLYFRYSIAQSALPYGDQGAQDIAFIFMSNGISATGSRYSRCSVTVLNGTDSFLLSLACSYVRPLQATSLHRGRSGTAIIRGRH